MAVAWDGNRAVYEGADECPDEAGHRLGVVCHELQTECQAVDIWAIVCNDAECENDKAEFAKAAKRGEEHGC